jgi:carboxylesterase
VGGLSMGGALVLRLAADHPDRIAGVVVVNPAVATKRLDVKLLPVLKHVVPSFPGIANDVKKPGVQEHGYDRTPLKAIHSMMRAWPVLVKDLPQITAPLLYFRSTEDHVVDEATEPLILSGVSSRDVTVTRLENSYHVATLDNDAERIFEDTAAFVARVTSGS